MTVTKRIRQFIDETANLAFEEDKTFTRQEYVDEYTNQVEDNDFYGVVNWANWKGIKIPVSLRNAIDPNF